MQENINIRFANEKDISQLQQLDSWTKEVMWRRKIFGREVIVLEIDSLIVGLARFDVIWSTVPFLSLIYIKEEHRKKGYSSSLLSFLKKALQDEGYIALLSSSQTDEPEAQNWHRHMGFKSNGIIENIADDDIGEIVFRIML